MTEDGNVIKVSDDGMLEFHGDFEVKDVEGNVWRTRSPVYLCRCGQSETKPFCDDSHAVKMFDSKVRAE